MMYREIIINGKPVKLIPLGDCACGCGGKTNVPQKNHRNLNMVKNRPMKFIQGHSSRGANNGSWQGGKKECHGYILILMPEHHRSNTGGYVFEHILIAEKSLGKPLIAPNCVHHYTPTQLVICEDHAYHHFLHQRQRAFEACGHANWLKCTYCKQYDDPKNMVVKQRHYRKSGYVLGCHQLCRKIYNKSYHYSHKLKEGS